MKKKINKRIWEKVVQEMISNGKIKNTGMTQRKTVVNIHHILSKLNKGI